MSYRNDCEPAISIGDLVRLRGDHELANGIGLVLDKRDDTADIVREFVEQLRTTAIQTLSGGIVYRDVFFFIAIQINRY